MNPNRSGTRQLSMSVPKLRHLLHEAFKAGAAKPQSTDQERRDYIAAALRDMQWR